MPQDQPRIYLSSPHMSGDELPLVREAFETNWIAPLGPHVEAFERELAERVGVAAALALNSGTAALHLGLKSLGVSPGDRIFCSSFTFIASVSPVVWLGAEPVFVDSEPDTWNMSPAALERAFEDAERTGTMPKAVIPADLYGQTPRMDTILALCDRYGVPLFEDAAEALGATYRGKSAGSFGRFGVLSFNGNKIITTSGGGALLSDDADAIAKARFWSTQARDPAPWYQHTEIGYNYRLSNVLAAIGRGQLRHLDERIAQRRAVFDTYVRAFADIPGISWMPEPEGCFSIRWLSTVLIDPDVHSVTPVGLMEALAQENIESRPLWKPMHLQPVFANNAYYPHSPEGICDGLFRRGLCLPSGSNLTEEQQGRVIAIVRRVLLTGRSR
jgi:pyridoxal phosphate-dependent aminotransferase EpsN